MEDIVAECCPTDCVYRMRLGQGKGSTFFCNYAVMERKARLCKVSECDKYRKGKRRMVTKSTEWYKWVITDEDD